MSNLEIYCTVIGAIAAVLAGVWFIVEKSHNAGKDSQKFDDIEKKVDAYSEKHNSCEKRFISIETTKADTLHIERRLDEIAFSIKNLISPTASKIITDPFTQTKSPLTLTTKGMEKSKNLGMESMIDSREVDEHDPNVNI